MQAFAELPVQNRYRATDGFDYAAPALRCWLLLHRERSTSPMTRASMAADFHALCPPEPTARYVACSLLPPAAYWLSAARCAASDGQPGPWFGRLPLALTLGAICLACTTDFADRTRVVTNSQPPACGAQLRRALTEAAPAAALAAYGAAIGSSTSELSSGYNVLLALAHFTAVAVGLSQLPPGEG